MFLRNTVRRTVVDSKKDHGLTDPRASAGFFGEASAPAWCLLATLLLIPALQWPALSGGFHFDDGPNLSDLGAYGGVETWETLRAYLTGGFAGPTGRPLSLLSFLIDDFTWPSTPENFKRTNLLLHLLNVSLLAWATLRMTRFYGLDERRSAWTAVGSAAFWGLHPYLISTTFYVVQRMAMLAATFSLAGMVAYLHGRGLWPERPRAALLWMAAGLGAGTVLATLSKENGALLPLLILVIEFCAPRTQPGLPRAFRWVFLYGPSLVLLAYLASYINLSEHPWPERPFNQIERVLTEARILWDYLGQWFLPRIEGAGLFRDGIEISRSLLDPPQTALAVAGLAFLLACALWLRRRTPFLALAVLFFLAGHLMESGWLGLELYFEHRNYLPSIFLFLPLSVWLVQVHGRPQRVLAWLVAGVLLAWLAFFSWQRARLWGDPVKLEVYWALSAPESPRAANALAAHWFRDVGDAAEAMRVLDQGLARHHDSGLLIMSRLLLQVKTGTANAQSFAEAAERLARVPFDAQVVSALRHLVDLCATAGASDGVRSGSRMVIERLQGNEVFRQFPSFRRLVPYLLARIALAQEDAQRAERLYNEAMSLYGQMDAAMQMVAEVGNAGYPQHALRLLDQAERLLAEQQERNLKFSRAFYQREIQRIRALLIQEQNKAPRRASE